MEDKSALAHKPEKVLSNASTCMYVAITNIVV